MTIIWPLFRSGTYPSPFSHLQNLPKSNFSDLFIFVNFVLNKYSVSVQLSCLLSLHCTIVFITPSISATLVNHYSFPLANRPSFFLSNVELYQSTQRRCVLGKNSIHICELITKGNHKKKHLWFFCSLTNAHCGTLSLLTFRASFHYLIDYERAVTKFVFPWPAEKVSIFPQQAYIMRNKNSLLKAETSVKPV